MKFNFRLSKSKASEDAEVTNTGVLSQLESTKTGVPDATAPHFSDRLNFSEHSRVTGIKSPPRGGTVTGLIAKQKQQQKKLRKYLKIGGAALVPVSALVVFFLLHTGSQSEEVPEMPAPQIAKNPNKGKSPAPSQQAGETAPLATQGPSQASATSAASPIPAELQKQFSPYATSALFSRPFAERKKPSPTVRLPAQAQTKHVPRESAAFLLYGKEVEQLQNTLRTDEDGKDLLIAWNETANRALSRNPQPLVSLSEGDGFNAEQHMHARNELNSIRVLAFASAAENKKEYVEKAHSLILLWSKTYRPSGDAIADRWLEPLIEAYGFTWRTMRPEDRGRVDLWLTEIANRQINEAAVRTSIDDLWYAHHMKLMTMIAYGLGRASLQTYVEEKFPQVIAASFKPNGFSSTYANTYSMALHLEHVAALLRSGIIFDRVGRAKPEYLPTPGQTIAKAIEIALPALHNKAQPIEFIFVKLPELKARQDAGDVKVAKLPFDRSGALEFFDVISYFKPSLAQVAGEAIGVGKKKFVTPRSAWFGSMNRDLAAYEAQSKPVNPELAAAPPTQSPATQPNVTQPSKTTQAPNGVPPGVPTELPQRQPATPQ